MVGQHLYWLKTGLQQAMVAISSHNKPGIISVKVTLGGSGRKKEKIPAENERENTLRERCCLWAANVWEATALCGDTGFPNNR